MFKTFTLVSCSMNRKIDSTAMPIAGKGQSETSTRWAQRLHSLCDREASLPADTEANRVLKSCKNIQLWRRTFCYNKAAGPTNVVESIFGCWETIKNSSANVNKCYGRNKKVVYIPDVKIASNKQLCWCLQRKSVFYLSLKGEEKYTNSTNTTYTTSLKYKQKSCIFSKCTNYI